MHALGIILACLIFAGHASKAQMTKRRARARLDQDLLNLDGLDGAVLYRHSLARLFLALSNPSLGWQVGGQLGNLAVNKPGLEYTAQHSTHRSHRSVDLSKLLSSLPGSPLASISASSSRSGVPIASAEDSEIDDDAMEDSDIVFGAPVDKAKAAPKSNPAPMEDADRPNMELRWVDMDFRAGDSEPRENATVMPLFPLGIGSLQVPFTTQVLTVFEPRYRALYNDILFSGARRFVVPGVNPETDQLSEVGVVYYLDDLKEVSEQTQDAVKYVCDHSIIGRVKLLKVLNPKAGITRETYMRAEVVDLDKLDTNEDTTAAEAKANETFQDLVDLQVKLNTLPRFNEQIKSNISFARQKTKEEGGIWSAVAKWQQWCEARRSTMVKKMQKDIQSAVNTYFQQDGVELPASGVLTLEDLPDPIVQEIRKIQERTRSELEDCNPHGDTFHAMVQSSSHAELLSIFTHVMDTERKRLAVLASLESILKSDK